MAKENPRIETGREGERLAARFLRKRGYKILRRNFRSRLGEIDLIARDGDEVVFVEVKTQTGGPGHAPEASVPRRQQLRIGRAAKGFATRHRLLDRVLRFDVVVVLVGEGRAPEIVHYRDAFTL